MKIDSVKILKCVPDLSGLNTTGSDGALKGMAIDLSWDGTWKTKLGKYTSLTDLEKEDVLLDSNVGQICLHDSFATDSDSAGNFEGQALFISIKDNSVKPSVIPSFLHVVKIDEKSIERIMFSESIEDSKTGFTWTGLLSFKYGIAEFNIFKIPNKPYLIVQASHPKLKLESFRSIANSCLYLFWYLTGLSISGDFCVVVLGEDEKPKETFIYGGLNQKSTMYTPVVVGWSEFSQAKIKLGLPLAQLIDRRPFDPDNMSKCFTYFVNKPDLMTSVVYLIASTTAPLEMKGVFLSVALESLTECLTKPKNPISDSIWQDIKTELEKTLIKNPLKLDNKTIELLQNKIRNLNTPTNSAKLIKPFEINKIILTKKDKKIISLRNVYLHTGRSGKLTKKRDKDYKEIYKTEMRLYTLINHLFLKVLGYEGILIDWESHGLTVAQSNYIRI